MYSSIFCSAMPPSNISPTKLQRPLSKIDSIIPEDIAVELEEEYDLLPSFQRISVSGEDSSGVCYS